MPYVPNAESQRLEQERVAANIQARSDAMSQAFEQRGIEGTIGFLQESGLPSQGGVVEEAGLMARAVHKIASALRRQPHA